MLSEQEREKCTVVRSKISDGKPARGNDTTVCFMYAFLVCVYALLIQHTAYENRKTKIGERHKHKCILCCTQKHTNSTETSIDWELCWKEKLRAEAEFETIRKKGHVDYALKLSLYLWSHSSWAWSLNIYCRCTCCIIIRYSLTHY